LADHSPRGEKGKRPVGGNRDEGKRRRIIGQLLIDNCQLIIDQ